jgi:organic hydroperoxide reductase OsmC/OhrA
MCFDDSFHFHEDVENPIRLCAQGAASCFENAILILLSRRFNAAHLFNTEEETGGD